MKRHLALICLALFLCAPQTLRAAVFRNNFVSFELPPGWNCNQEDTEWVCQSALQAEKKRSIIVLAAKLRGKQDSLAQYQDYLSHPKRYTSVDGKPITSKVLSTRSVTITNQEWIVSVHDSSEIPGFATKYYATIKDDIAVLITYSVVMSDLESEGKVLDDMMRSLRILR